MFAFPKFRGVVSDTLKNVGGLFALLGSQIASIGSALMQLATGQFRAAWANISTAGTRSLDDMQVALDGYDNAIASAGTFTDGFKFDIGELADGVDAFIPRVGAAADKAKDLAKAFADSLRPADALNVELDRLAQLGFTTSEIVAVYGDQILSAPRRSESTDSPSPEQRHASNHSRAGWSM